jgi:hypothetical protein
VVRDELHSAEQTFDALVVGVVALQHGVEEALSAIDGDPCRAAGDRDVDAPAALREAAQHLHETWKVRGCTPSLVTST